MSYSHPSQKRNKTIVPSHAGKPKMSVRKQLVLENLHVECHLHGPPSTYERGQGSPGKFNYETAMCMRTGFPITEQCLLLNSTPRPRLAMIRQNLPADNSGKDLKIFTEFISLCDTTARTLTYKCGRLVHNWYSVFVET